MKIETEIKPPQLVELVKYIASDDNLQKEEDAVSQVWYLQNILPHESPRSSSIRNILSYTVELTSPYCWDKLPTHMKRLADILAEGTDD